MNIFYRLLAVTLLLSNVPCLLGCQSPSANTSLFVNSDFAPTTAFGYTPFEFVVPPVDSATLVQGFDAQLAAQIARRLGFNGAEFNQTAFGINETGNTVIENLLLDVENGTPQSNIGISAISITPNRIKNFPELAFIPYNDDDMSIILQSALVAGDPLLQKGATVLARLNTLAFTLVDLQTVFTLFGSRQASTATGFGSGIIAQSINTIGSPYNRLESAPNGSDKAQFDNIQDAVTALLAALKAGNRRSLFIDTPTALALQKQGLIPGFTVVTGVIIDPSLNAFSSLGLGIAIPAECCQLYANIAKAIQDMEDEGVLAAMRAKWGTGSFTPPAVNLVPSGCANTTANINSNAIANYIFTKYCPQVATIVSPE